MTVQVKRILLFILMALPGFVALAQNGEPCRIDEASLEPIIDRFNPFFTDHSWDNDEKTETARMDPNRLLIIRQKACVRHHVLLSLVLDPSVVESGDKFWVTETFVLMKRAYFNNSDYLLYKKKFEKDFIAYFQENGLNRSFTFPVDDRTFICKIEQGDWGAKIIVEMVRYVLNAKVKMPGIPREKDDGWFKPQGTAKNSLIRRWTNFSNPHLLSVNSGIEKFARLVSGSFWRFPSI